MQALAACLSHTPLQGLYDPVVEVRNEISEAIATLRKRVVAFDPELVVLFAPDHFNGFFYDIMPPFCIGVAAEAVGDFDTLSGSLNVAAEVAGDCAAFVMAAGFDVTVSHRMQVDHGFSAPLKDIFGSLASPPILPIFINSVAPPLASCRRIRMLGETVGRYAAGLDRRVLFIGSGGLSHEPPVPQMATASPEVAKRMIDGRNPDAAANEARLGRLLTAAKRLTMADPEVKPLNPDWDQRFMAMAGTGDLSAFDSLRDADIEREAGASAHEVRTWIAALAATGAGGGYTFDPIYYRAVPEWIAGFGVASAVSLNG